MQKYIYTAFFLALATNPINGLKLLVEEDDDEDTTWESDIEFSVKPFLGKCKDALAGGGSEPGKYNSNNGLLGQACQAASDNGASVSAASALKYCEKVKGAANANYNVVFNAAQALYVNAAKPAWYKKSRKYMHYVAKLASMNNAEAVVTSGSSVAKVVSFQFKVDDGAVVFYAAAALSGDSATGYYCYSKASMTWAKNDPIVKNMDGEEFEIMATGTFSLLTVKLATETLFEASATIDRAGTRCGATYIQNITLSGGWVKDEVKVPQIQIKAEASVPKAKALQVNFNGEWQHSASHLSYAIVKHANANKLNLKLNHLDLTVSIDSHRIHEEGTKTRRFANFLNINFGGISEVSGVSLGGLLGRDSHQAAAELPQGCEAELANIDSDSRMLSHVDMA